MVIATRTPRTLPCWAAGPRCSRSLVRLHRIAAYGLVIALLLHLGGCASAPAAVSVTPSATTDVEVEVATTPITATATLLTPVIEATVAAATATKVAEVAATTTVAPTKEVAPTPVTIEMATYTGEQNLLILSSPDNNFSTDKRMGTLTKGTKVEVLEKVVLENTTWLKIKKTDGKEGYIPYYDTVVTLAKESIQSPTAPKTPEVVATPSIPMAIAKNDINLRQGPGTGYELIGTLASGGKVEVIGKTADGTWLKVRIPSGAQTQEAWISAGLVTQTGPTEKIAIVAYSGGQTRSSNRCCFKTRGAWRWIYSLS